jgi:hypothetical protein
MRATLIAIAFAAGIGLAGAPSASATSVNGLLIGQGASVVDPVEQVGVPGVPGWRWRRRGARCWRCGPSGRHCWRVC